MKKTVFFGFAIVGALISSIVLNNQSASAVSGSCYYGSGTCSVSGVGDCGTNDVLPGRGTDCSGSALGGIGSKAEFINRIINLSDNGGRAQRGARFIMRETTGTIDKAEFRRILEQSNVTFSFVNDTGSVSSWYDPGKNDFFYASYPGGWSSRPVIKIKQNGNVKSVIEVWCGNMTGTHSEVSPPPNTTISPLAELPDAGPYTGGQSVQVKAGVNKSGPDTRSNWAFTVWYDQNANSANDDGAGNVIASDSGGPTLYGTAYTNVKNQNRTIDGSKNKICVRFNLSAPTDNTEGGNTNITGDPDVKCRDIAQPFKIKDWTVVSPTTAEPGQSVTFTSRFQNIDPGPANGINVQQRWGWTGQNTSDNITAQNTYNFTSGQERVVSDTFTIPSSAANNSQYCRHSAANPWKTDAGLDDNHDNSNGWGDPACVTVTIPNVNRAPTGTITKIDTCSFSDTSHQISYSGLNDPNGGTPNGKVTTSSASDSTGVVSGPATSGAFTRPHGAVTYYLWVQDIAVNGSVLGYVNVGQVTTSDPRPCPEVVNIDPDATLMDGTGSAPLSGSSVTSGTQVKIRTRVYNNGNSSTTSQWIREFWYDANGNSAYDSGEVRAAPTSSGGPTTYSPLVYTSVGTVPGAISVDGTKTRICVALRLTSVASTPITNVVAPNPAVDCKDIVAVPNDLTPTVTATPSEVEPGQTVTATALVNCSISNAASSNYRRILWFENGGNTSRYDDPSDVVVTGRDVTGNGTYCVSNPFGDWTVVVPATGVTRVCTSLQLMNPVSSGATIPSPPNDIRSACADVATKYFFQVTNGDVNAAACLTDCSTTPTISAFNGGLGTAYRGSGAQVGAFATGRIDGFTSGSDPLSFMTGVPKRLTFANSGAGSASTEYGGGFTQRYAIPSNYWSGPAVGGTTVTSASPTIVRQPGNILVLGSRAVTSVDVGDVQQLQWVISEGDIYIDRSVVGDLYGIYIAKGNIYTCTNGFSRYTLPSSTLAANCNQPLVVHGALIAGNSVKLQRAIGSLSSGGPAEVIDYNPFVWMQGIKPVNALPTSTSGKLDFITTLPPIL